MKRQPNKTARISVRVTPAQRKQIRDFATYFDLSVSAFLLDASTIAAAIAHHSRQWHRQRAKARSYIKDTQPWNI